MVLLGRKRLLWSDKFRNCRTPQIPFVVPLWCSMRGREDAAFYSNLTKECFFFFFSFLNHLSSDFLKEWLPKPPASEPPEELLKNAGFGLHLNSQVLCQQLLDGALEIRQSLQQRMILEPTKLLEGLMFWETRFGKCRGGLNTSLTSMNCYLNIHNKQNINLLELLPKTHRRLFVQH